MKGTKILFIVIVLLTVGVANASCEKLGCAIENGNLSLVQQLIGQGVDVNQLDPEEDATQIIFGRSPLEFALEAKEEDIAIALLKAGANPAYTDEYRHTALDSAAMQGLMRVVKFIVENKLMPIDGFNKPGKQFKPLTYALINGNRPMVTYLLDQGAKAVLPKPESPLSHGPVHPIDEAFSAGREDMARMFIDHGLVFAEVKDLADETLHNAARGSNHAYVEQILASGWDPDKLIAYGVKPLGQAFLNCRHQERIVKTLLDYDVNGCVNSFMTKHNLLNVEAEARGNGLLQIALWTIDALEDSAKQCWLKPDLLERLHHPIASAICHDASSAAKQLECSLRKNDTRTIQAVLTSKPPTFTEERLSEALNTALLSDSQEVANILLESNDIMCPMAGSLPVLHRAMVLGRFRTLNYWLLQERALRQCNQVHNFSTLHTAVLQLDYEAAKAALEQGADPNQRDTFGFTPWMFALGLGAEDLVVLLVEGGANLNLRSDSGHTALHFSVIGDAHVWGEFSWEFPLSQLEVTDHIDGRTPLLTAVASECPASDIAKLVLNGADKCLADKHKHTVANYLNENTIRPFKQRLRDSVEDSSLGCPK